MESCWNLFNCGTALLSCKSTSRSINPICTSGDCLVPAAHLPVHGGLPVGQHNDSAHQATPAARQRCYQSAKCGISASITLGSGCWQARAPAHAFQPLAGRLLLQHTRAQPSDGLRQVRHAVPQSVFSKSVSGPRSECLPIKNPHSQKQTSPHNARHRQLSPVAQSPEHWGWRLLFLGCQARFSPSGLPGNSQALL